MTTVLQSGSILIKLFVCGSDDLAKTEHNLFSTEFLKGTIEYLQLNIIKYNIIIIIIIPKT